jgi:hypothetical protein
MNLAVTEMSEGAFNAYVIALGISGILLLIAALIGFGATTISRVISGLVGLAFLGYAIYLEFFFEGGEFRIVIYAFIVPILVLINVFRSRKQKREAAAAATPPTAA